MRILINTLGVLPGENGGVETYLRGLLRALLDADRDNSYLILGTTFNRELWPSGAPNAVLHSARIDNRSRPKRVLYEQLWLPFVARRWRADLVFFPGNMISALLSTAGIPAVVTIHDAAARFYQQHFPAYYPNYGQSIWLMRRLVTFAARRSAVVMTDSQFSRDEVSAFTGVPTSKIVVVQPGCPAMTPVAQEPAVVLQKYGVSAPYILTVGRSMKHKNFDSLVCAYAQARRAFRFPHHLVIAGPPGLAQQDVVSAIQQHGAEELVHLTGYLPPGELPVFYQNAALFVMPSLYEGFGFPVLEAMQVGVPTLLSDAASLPEVGGQAAEYFNPLSVSGMAEALGRVLGDQNLQRRLAADGRLQAARFSWRKSAAETLQAWRLAVSSGDRRS